MFEFSRNSKIAISVDNHFNEYTPSQGKSVPTDRQTGLMHRYVLIESHRKTSVALWVHPLMLLLGYIDRPNEGNSIHDTARMMIIFPISKMCSRWIVWVCGSGIGFYNARQEERIQKKLAKHIILLCRYWFNIADKDM